jgi:hypothetical protein
MVVKDVMSVENDTTQMNRMTMEMTLIECGMRCMNSNRPEGITTKDEEDEMLAKFWADYGESMWVDPMEQEELWDEKNFI